MSERTSSPWSIPLWCASIVLWAIAVWAWWPSSDPAPTNGRRGLPPHVDLDTFVAAPPVDGPPDPVALDAAIAKGTQAYLERYVDPWLECAEAGGRVEYVDADGDSRELGPNVYVQCQLYLLVHLLMYWRSFGLEWEDERVQRAHRWFLDTFDEDEGRWLWSEEGCLHPKSLIVFGESGDRRFQRAWNWARSAPFHRLCTVPGLFSIQRSGNIVQTLGPAVLSLSERFEWEHEQKPVPDEENTAKYLYALLAAGRSADEPEVAQLRQRLAQYLIESHRPLGVMNTHHLLGRAWYVLCHTHFRLPPDDGYRLSLATLRAAIRGEWRSNFQLRSIPLFRAIFVRALLEAGDRGPEIDAWVHGFVVGQDEDGSWRVPHVDTVWSLGDPPVEGIKIGNMDGAVTYMTTLALIAYRDRTAR